MKVKFVIPVLLLCSAIVVRAQSPEEIVNKSREVMKVHSFEAYSTLLISDARGNERIRQSTMASRSYPDGSEKRVIKFTSPPEVSGTGILIFDYKDKSDDLWIYLPALRQTRRIVSSEKSKSFMGSEFSNSDMTAPSVKDFTYKLLGSEKMDEKECWKIEAEPVNAALKDEYGYSKSVLFISKSEYVPMMTEYYNFDGELFKTIKTLGYQLLDKVKGKYMVTDMLATNLKNGRKSEMKMDKIQQAETDEQYFTVTWLEKN